MLLEAGLKQKYCFGNRPLNIVQFMDDNLGLVTEKIRFLNNLFKAYRCVSFLIVRTPLGSNRISVYGEEEALCDGIMILGSRKVGQTRRRNIEVYKLRNQKHVFGECGMDISKNGIKVFYVGKGGGR
jgi:KaiC/GvpD/RAD55 family RecA-like ATPase